MLRSVSFLVSAARSRLPNHPILSRTFTASAPSLTNLSVRPDGVAVIELSRPPVNSLNRVLMEDLTKSLVAAAQHPDAKAVVLTSSKFGIFSAGLDINEMIVTGKPDVEAEDRLFAFWTTLQDMWLQLYAHPLPVVAAINGHAPAGGCLLSMSCDYRVMSSGPFKIGLNETQLGIAAPLWFAETMTAIVGQRQTEKLLQLGTMLSAEEAAKIGLVDDVVAPELVFDKSVEVALKFAALPRDARHKSKMVLRQRAHDYLLENRDHDANSFVEFICGDLQQATIKAYVQSLTKKTDKK